MTQRGLRVISPRWIDVSVPLKTGMVHWPDNPPVKISRIFDMDRGDPCNVSAISMGAHTGTHMDAPRHFLANGNGMEQMPLDATVGRARVIAIRDKESIKVAELRKSRIQHGERILFKTVNSNRCWSTDVFVEDFVFISHEAAAYLADRKARTIGVDYLSVGGFRIDGVKTHRALLEGGIWIIEGLNLAKVAPGRYNMVCLPLKIVGCDGAPARAILQRRA